MSYDTSYKQRKPLSSRLRVESGTKPPDKVKQRPQATAPREGLPNYMKPVRVEGKPQD